VNIALALFAIKLLIISRVILEIRNIFSNILVHAIILVLKAKNVVLKNPIIKSVENGYKKLSFINNKLKRLITKEKV